MTPLRRPATTPLPAADPPQDVTQTPAGRLPGAGADDAPPAPAFPDPIPDLIPFGALTTLSGASGVGKTAYIAGFIRTMQVGGELFERQVNPPVAVGVLACDRPWRDHQAWFTKAGCDPIPHCSLRDQEYQWALLKQPQPEKIAKIFGQLVDSIGLPPGSLLIVDPLPIFLSGRLIDYKDMAIALGLIDNEIKKRQLSMLGVFHVSKQKSNKNDRYLRPQDRILGSAALIGYSETAFYLLSPEEAERSTYELGYVAHQVPAAAIQLKRTESGLFVPAHELDAAQDEERAFSCFPPEGTTIAASVILDAVRKHLKVSESTAKRLILRFIQDGRIVRVGRGLYERAKPC